MISRVKLLDKVKAFPVGAGVYLMKDKKGDVVYVGKAKNLRARVRQYFLKRQEGRAQVEFLMRRVADIQAVLTDTDKEAILLENTLIKKHRPRYNIQLKDDKSYLSLKLNIGHRFPRLIATRDIKKDESLYFGPYASAAACRETLDFIEREFRLRSCSDAELKNRSRPCMKYEVGRCTAPCVGLVGEEDYAGQVEKVRMFLGGRADELKRVLEKEMQAAAEAEDYEAAARARDLIKNISVTLERQKVAAHRAADEDFIGFYREGEYFTIAVMMVRGGKVWDTRAYHLESLAPDSAVLEDFLRQYYGEGRYMPEKIFLPFDPPEKEEGFVVPRCGAAADMVRLAGKNAVEAFRQHRDKKEAKEETLFRLQKGIGLQKFPNVIECYDISNLQGKDAVGSLVTFTGGEPDKKRYRRFKIRSVAGADDPAMIAEVLRRRFKFGDMYLLRVPEFKPPDLIVIDGGKGQLGAAVKVLEDLKVTGVPCVALAKRKEGEKGDKIFIPGRKNPLRLPPHSSALHLLMRVRDEAHRFAINYNRRLRSKNVFGK